MQFLKADTAVTLKIGPFIDDTDGKTAETALTIAQADVRLSKNGGDIAQKTEATSCTHDELGIYGCPIDATDTNTEGRLQLWVHESGALPVWHEYMVVNANVYDSLYAAAATDYLKVKDDEGNTLANEAKQDIIDTVVDGIQTDLSNATDGLGALKALIDTLDTVADAIKAVTDVLPDGGALDDLASILTDTGTTLPATLATIAGYLDTEVAAILTDTGTTLPATLATIAGYLDTEVAAILAAVDTEVAAIKAKTDLLPSGVPKNVARANFPFKMVDSTDHVTPETGATVTAQISKDGGAFASMTNSVTEISGGWYEIDITQAEMNADVIVLKFTATGCDQTDVVICSST